MATSWAILEAMLGYVGASWRQDGLSWAILALCCAILATRCDLRAPRRAKMAPKSAKRSQLERKRQKTINPPASGGARSGAVGYASRSFLFIKFNKNNNITARGNTEDPNVIRDGVFSGCRPSCERPSLWGALPVIRQPPIRENPEPSPSWTSPYFSSSVPTQRPSH